MVTKKSVLSTIIQGAKDYSKLLGRTFVFKSDSFRFKKEYAIKFHKNNFLHLTGVITKLSPDDFYESAFNGTLTENDFDITSNTNSLLSTHVEMKMHNLSDIHLIVDSKVMIEEQYQRGKITCSLASSNGKFTLCFIGSHLLAPMSLLYGNTLHKGDSIKDLIAKEIFK